MVASEETVHRFFEDSGDLRRRWNCIHDGNFIPPALIAGIQYPVAHDSLPDKYVDTRIVEVTCDWHELPVIGSEVLASLRSAELFYRGAPGAGRPTYLSTTVDYSSAKKKHCATCNTIVQCFEEYRVELGPSLNDAPHDDAAEAEELSAVEETFLTSGAMIGRLLPSAVRNPLTRESSKRWAEFVGLAPDENPLNPQYEDLENGILRFAFLVSMISQWLGSNGQLNRIRVLLSKPTLISEVIRFSGEVRRKISDSAEGSEYVVEILGANALGETVTRAWAEVMISQVEPVVSVSALLNRQRPTKVMKFYRDPHSVLEQISNACVQNGKRVAIVDRDFRLSYSDLDFVTDELARALAVQGVKPNQLVAVCMSRNIDSVIALLGVLKCGAGFLFLDPKYPRHRIEAMLSGTEILLYSQDNFELASMIHRDVKSTSFESLLIDNYSVDNLFGAGNIAYQMFTSGSSGMPKPVEISHRQLSLSLDSLKALEYGPEDVCLHTASFSFSASIRQLFVPLINGASVVLSSEEVSRDPLLRMRWMAANGVTVWDTTPSALRQTCDFLDSVPYAVQESLIKTSCLRRVQVTGERLTQKVAEDWARISKRIPIFNLYSQTETAGTISVEKITASTQFVQGIAPVGQPLPGNEISIRTDQNEQAGVGEIGKIYIRSNRFLHLVNGRDSSGISKPDAFDELAWHATGDLGLKTIESETVVIGRYDGAVNVRGYRISPAEIELTFLAHRGVADAAVIAYESLDDNPRLCAFFCATQLMAIDQMRLTLPRHMQPDIIHQLARLPKLPSGKVDRAALKALVPLVSAGDACLESNFSDLERTIAAIWEAETGVRVDSKERSFFDCGGDSLSAVRVIAAIEQSFQYSIPLRFFFEAVSLKELAAVVDRRETISPSPVTVLKVVGSNSPVFFVAGLGGHSYQFLRLVNLMIVDRPCYGLEYPAKPTFTVQEIARHMIQKMREIQPEGPYFIVGHSFGGRVCYEIACQVQEEGQIIEFLGLVDVSAPIVDFRGKMMLECRIIFQLYKKVALAIKSRQLMKKVRTLGTKRATYWRMAMPEFASADVADQNYEPGPYSGSATLFRANDSLEGPLLLRNGSRLGWNAFITPQLKTMTVPGNHMSVLSDPDVHQLAAALTERLSEFGC